jgi:DNA replication ATP-dependent helicase/nuclease Dna2
VPVSEKTKSKLNQFQFQSVEGNTADNAQQENHQVKPDKSATPTKLGLESEITPPGRVSLRDLLNRQPGHAEDEEAEFSPEEKVGWDSNRPRNVDISSMMPPRKGRKRARSSSPISSPAHDILRTPAPPAIDRKRLTEALNSPHADPTLQLWDRLSMGSKANVTPLSTTSAGLSKFTISSSPRPPKDGLTSGRSLRRTMSSGLSWPKRRRLDKSDSTVTSKSAGHSDNTCKSSLVSALLDTVESRQSPNAVEMDHEPSQPAASPSPSPSKRRGGARHRTVSPLPPVQGSPNNDAAVLVAPQQAPRTNTVLDLGDAESDYGDDGLLDDDTFMQLEATVATGQVTTAQPPVASNSTLKIEKPAPVLEEIDEFDDFDDDNILEAAASMLDNLESAAGHPKPVTTPQVVVAEQGALDEFGDDFDDDFGNDFDFDAAEIAATQSANPSSQHLPPAHVRARSPRLP